jgi:hypothetical protein
MFWTGVAVGCFIGAAFGVLIMALVVAGKESDERMIIDDNCQKCGVFKGIEVGKSIKKIAL